MTDDPAALVTVDPGSPVPPFEQVRAVLAARIADRTLVAGTRLPTVRGLADRLGLAAATVARAYRELEAAGLVETRGRGGTVVSAAGDRSRDLLRAEAQRFAELARGLGVPAAEAVAMVRGALGGR